VRVDGPDGYWVSDDPALLDVARIHRWLSRDSYWARGRSYAAMARAIEHSLSVGLNAADGTQAGYARLVTGRTIYRRLGFGDLARTERWVERAESLTASGTSPAGRPTGDQEMR
jgi:hypothetical protein